jgi:hypothetical protein
MVFARRDVRGDFVFRRVAVHMLVVRTRVGSLAGGTRADVSGAVGRLAVGSPADGRPAEGRPAEGRLADSRPTDGRPAAERQAEGRKAVGG